MILKIFCVPAYSVEAVFKKVLQNVLAEKKVQALRETPYFQWDKNRVSFKKHDFLASS